MATKKSKKKGWGLLHGTVEQDYADIKRWEASLTDVEWEKLLRQGEKDIRKIEAESRRRFPRLRRQRAA